MQLRPGGRPDCIAVVVVDNRSPSIPPATLLPLDHSNVLAAKPQMAARITDAGGSGVNAASIAFKLTSGSGSSWTFSGSDVTFDTATRWARIKPTAAPTLVVNERYTLEAEVADVAGNVARTTHAPITDGGGFQRITANAAVTQASIREVPCDLEPGSTAATKKVVCRNVPLYLNQSTVTISGTRFEMGAGAVLQTAPLQTAQLRTSSAPGAVFPYNASDANWAPKTKAVPFRAGAESVSTQSLNVPSYEAPIAEPLTAGIEVPVTWTDAFISMPEVTTTATFSADSCADSTVGANALLCSNDPFHSIYEVELKSSVGDVTAAANSHAAKYDVSDIRAVDPTAKRYVANVDYSKAVQLATDATVAAVRPMQPFGYWMSGEQLRSFDATSTPQGQAAIAEFAAEPPGPGSTASSGACLPPVGDIYLLMSTAIGRPRPLDDPYLSSIVIHDSQRVDYYSMSVVGNRLKDEMVTSSGGTCIPDPPPAPDPDYMEPRWHSLTGGQETCPAGKRKMDGYWFMFCYDTYRVYGDNTKVSDGYGHTAHIEGDAQGTRSRLDYMYVHMIPVVDVLQHWQGPNPVTPDSYSGNCIGSQAGFSYVIEYTWSITRCETWEVTPGDRAGEATARWEGKASSPREVQGTVQVWVGQDLVPDWKDKYHVESCADFYGLSTNRC